MKLLVWTYFSIIIMVIFFMQMDFQLFFRHNYPKLAKWIGWHDDTLFSLEAFLTQLFHPWRVHRLLFSRRDNFIEKNKGADFIDEYVNLVNNEKYRTKKRTLMLSIFFSFLSIVIIMNLSNIVN